MDASKLQQPVTDVASREFTALAQDLTVAGALARIREHGVADRIVYFYVVDGDQRLVGVLPTRRLLITPVHQRVGDVMIARVVALPETATVLDACELFTLHKFLAIPVVDGERRLVGVVNIDVFTEEIFDLTERDRMADIFQRIGFRVSEVQNASPWKAFRHRFPWLLATIATGSVCAVLAGAYETTLAQSLVLAFFLTLVLGLGESVSAQSLTLTVQALHGANADWPWLIRALRREVGTALLLGTACGAVVGLVVFTWRGVVLPAAVIGGSVVLAMLAACLIGLVVPVVLHRFKLDPKIAAGPVALGLADVFTLLFYFNLARAVL